MVGNKKPWSIADTPYPKKRHRDLLRRVGIPP
jgi:hypothetical protein